MKVVKVEKYLTTVQDRFFQQRKFSEPFGGPYKPDETVGLVKCIITLFATPLRAIHF